MEYQYKSHSTYAYTQAHDLCAFSKQGSSDESQAPAAPWERSQSSREPSACAAYGSIPSSSSLSLSLSLFGDGGGVAAACGREPSALVASHPTGAAAAARLRGHGGVRCTVAVTRFVVGLTKPCLGSSSVHVVVFSDGCDEGGPADLGGHRGPYFERLEEVGSVALDELVWEEAEQGRPATVVLYDTFMPWVPQLAPQIDESQRAGGGCIFLQLNPSDEIPSDVPCSRRGGEASPSVDMGAPAGATFLTQTCAVDMVYTHARSGENRGDGDATATARRLVAEQVAVSARWLSRRSRPTMRSERKKRRPRRCRRGGHRTRRCEVWPWRRHRCQSAPVLVAV
nr:uncharacterized protein LOC107280277 [Oryza sativa Japonica Group]